MWDRVRMPLTFDDVLIYLLLVRRDRDFGKPADRKGKIGICFDLELG